LILIGDEEIVKRILKHLGLRDCKKRRPHKATGPPKVQEYSIDYSMSQLPCFADLVDDEDGSDKWLARVKKGHRPIPCFIDEKGTGGFYRAPESRGFIAVNRVAVGMSDP
jgi:hypothetical protein